MAYIERKGNLFDSDADTLVNTVNCVGVMGKGIALEFRRRYPEMQHCYQQECESGRLHPGDIWFYSASRPRILCLAVKAHWRFPSRYEWVERCLQRFRAEYRQLGIASVAFPWIGAMNGQLDWPRVHAIMRRYLSALPDVDVEVVEYDRHAADPLFRRLCEEILTVGATRFAEAAHISIPHASLIYDAVRASRATSMATVCHQRGLGAATVDRIYAHLAQATHVEPRPQLALFEA